ncbi:MAG: hypothetical protein SFY81_02180 [Verrucomicrobiota bacterium]|nr:hypothetical protein [Verrucomicrobiota bacterium]
MDICDACWLRDYKDNAANREGFISQWQTTYHVPPPAPPEAIQKDTAETLLRKLLERAEERYLAARYILAVMLERKRILKVKAQINEGGGRVFLYEHAREGDVFAITDPNLQLNELEQVQRDVAHLLEHGLEEPQPLASAELPATTSMPEATPEPKNP